MTTFSTFQPPQQPYQPPHQGPPQDEESTTDLHNHNDNNGLNRSECETFPIGGKSTGEDKVESREAKDADLQNK